MRTSGSVIAMHIRFLPVKKSGRNLSCSCLLPNLIIGGIPNATPVVSAPAGPFKPLLTIYTTPLVSQSVISHFIPPAPPCHRICMYVTHLGRINRRMRIIPLLHLDAQHIVDAQALQHVHGQRRRQVRNEHVVGAEVAEDVLGDGFFRLPLQGVFAEVLADEGAAGFLPGAVGGGVVGGGEAEEPGRVGEGD